jgi:hypothetical protein
MAAFGTGRGRRTLNSFAYLDELPFELVQFGKLLLDEAQLLGHQALQPGPDFPPQARLLGL